MRGLAKASPDRSEICRALADIHAAVRRRLAQQPPETDFVGVNDRGHRRRRFDLAADQVVADELRRLFPDGMIHSEEASARQIGSGPPGRRFLVDPVDGSDNHARGLPLSAVSVAVLDLDGPFSLDRVQVAMVGGLDEDEPLIAERGRGALRGGRTVSVSHVVAVSEAMVACELNHSSPSARLATLISRARGVRTYGCASRTIALVASGSLDAYVDPRGRLGPESFLAAAFAVEEAGGTVVDLDGNNFQHLRDPFGTARIVAAATSELAREITEMLDGDPA